VHNRAVLNTGNHLFFLIVYQKLKKKKKKKNCLHVHLRAGEEIRTNDFHFIRCDS
jgi:preprotein translocase subunit YajC